VATDDTITLPQSIQDPKRSVSAKTRRSFRPTKPCQHEGCEGWAWSQGYCNTHYNRFRNLGLLLPIIIKNDDVARFHTKYKVNSSSGCWEWTDHVHGNGYGQFHVTTDGIQKKLRAHRFSYRQLVGSLPDDMMVLHRCDNRRCVNPDHLFLGDASDNMLDCVSKGRHVVMTMRPSMRITWPMATTIRILYARGQHSVPTLAKIFLAGEETVRQIVKGKAHLTPPSCLFGAGTGPESTGGTAGRGVNTLLSS
jgi:hypothetical protein